MGKNRKKKKDTSQLATPYKGSRIQRKKAKQREKNRQKIEQIPEKISPSQLAEWKERLDPVVYEANTRIAMIQSAGYTSLALDKVIHEGGRDYFDIDDITSREELIAENTRMRVFLNDTGSTLNGAKLETAQIYAEPYKGKFGGQYKPIYGVTFDTTVIDPEIAKEAFKNYRKIESETAALIGEQGKPGVYGSENLIIAIYDAEVRGKDSYAYGKDLLNTFDKQVKEFIDGQQRIVDEVDAISGMVDFEMKGGRLF